MLYARGEVQPFDGQIVEYYPDHARKLALEIKHGRLNGHSLGWHANGQMEVDEQFVDGISQGTRKRWFPNGQQRSEADVQNGKVTGTYKEWHENGQLAVVMSTEDGKANGAVEAWHPSGALKSRSQMKQGEVLERQFFPDSVAQAQTAQQLPQ